MGSALPCSHSLTGRSWGRCKHSGASSGDNLWLVSYSMILSHWCKHDEASLSVEESRQPHPLIYSALFIEVIVHWGWPELWLISNALCSSKRICIWDVAQQQGVMLGSCACKSRYIMAVPGVSGHLCTALGDIHRHPTFKLPGLVTEVRVKVLSIAKYSALCCCKFIISCTHIS